MQPHAEAGRTRCGRLISDVSHAELVMACESLQARVEGLEVRCAMLEHSKTTSDVLLHETRRSVESLAETVNNTAWELGSWDDLLQWAWRAFSACIRQWRDHRWHSSKRPLENSDVETGGQAKDQGAEEDQEFGDGSNE